MLTFEERLERLERRNTSLENQNRWLKRAGMLGVVALGTVWLIVPAGAQQAEKVGTIKTREIVLVDDTGKPRLELGVDKNGAGLEIKDAQGKTRVVVGEGTIPGLDNNPGAGVWIFDDKERPRVGVGVGKDGVGLVVLDEKGKPVDGAGK
jgi:hypothetical protein